MQSLSARPATCPKAARRRRTRPACAPSPRWRNDKRGAGEDRLALRARRLRRVAAAGETIMPVKAQRRQRLDALQQVPAGAASAPDFFATEMLKPTWPLAMALCRRSAARTATSSCRSHCAHDGSHRQRVPAGPCGASPRRELVGSMGEQTRAGRHNGARRQHIACSLVRRRAGEAGCA